MSFSYIDSEVYYSSSTAGTQSDTPAGLNVQAGDLLVALYASRYASLSDLVIAESDGTDEFDLFAGTDYGTSFSLNGGSFVIEADDADFIVRASHTDSVAYRCLTVIQFRPDSGESITIDASYTAATGNDNAPTSPTIETLGTDDVIINAIAQYAATYAPSSWTINDSAVDGNIGTNTRLRTAYEVMTSADSSVAGVAALGGTSTWISAIIAFKASAASGSVVPKMMLAHMEGGR